MEIEFIIPTKPRTNTMGVTTQRASQLYFILAMGGKLSPSEKAELDEYASRFEKKKDSELLDDL